ncbi:bifunctional non-homologous end joining protein LigD [Paenibacillus shirakamiensis]|uniref:DNA ligase (ATP) n=1 Tax=Paenibacillus shirakamiensis TaxID=1265935 RepID=A0ABS4JG52_9BACL|nr:RNA ligase family protein [Paenibacillus shirakamiensis]MBP2000694.1 bifunctional non-homologous end joining protein LigD [Paenibacillus shirakamiensis]
MKLRLEPVIPFEPISTSHLPQGKAWTAQMKWDGVRMLTYYDGQNVRLINRKLNERSQQYPELLPIHDYCTAKSIILDGEIIAFDAEGKPSFHEVMRRDAVRRLQQIPTLTQQVPITYMVFDLLFLNGEWVIDFPLKKRQDLLRKVILPSTLVQVTADFDAPESLYKAALQHGLEGILVKDLNSTYAVNGKDKRWMKRKVIQDTIAVVGGYTLRGNIANALMLGLYDEHAQLHYIGHAGTGRLTSADWRQITAALQTLTIQQSPFTGKVSRAREALWVQPALTVKVNYLKWTPGGTLRQPSIQAFVTQNPLECIDDRG